MSRMCFCLYTLVAALHLAPAQPSLIRSTSDSAQTNLWSQLLNITIETIEEIEDMISRFAFTTDVTADDLAMIQYKPDGTNLSILLSDTEGIGNFDLDLDNEVIIITHGWLDQGTSPWVQAMASAFHSVGLNNTLALDWKDIAWRNYFASAQATKNVGEVAGVWLYHLLGENSSNFKSVHLIGHSLGAHVVGFVGKQIIELTNGTKIGRITGLEVAGPLFESPLEKPPHERFDKDDGDHVEAYHTDKGLLGYLNPVAQQDFYVNDGGPIQPGCYNILIFTAISCSHQFALSFFTKTIPSYSYIAVACPFVLFGGASTDCANNLTITMGQSNNGTNVTGVFYGNTDSNLNPV